MRLTIEAICPDDVLRRATVIVSARYGSSSYSKAATVNAHGRKVAGFILRHTDTGLIVPDTMLADFPEATWRFYVRPEGKHAAAFEGGVPS
jgi:hypothetical protein